MNLRLVPVSFADACAFVAEWHRHHEPPAGHKFSIGAVARHFDNGHTLEVLRTATDGAANANSLLYGAAWRAAKALGYDRLITYTQAGESGSSLRAVGWRVVAERAPRPGWDAPSRPRVQRNANVQRFLVGGVVNVLSLFAGIGGLDLGLERAGMTVVGQVEIDPFCRAVLAKHWPEVPRHDDVRTAVEWWLGEPRPAVDVVCGGFPCQPVSLAGRGRAQADERWLWPAAWAVIRDLRPRWAVLENVPGLLARGMGDVLGDLAQIGYDAEWDCVPASAVGALHRRDRVFIVAHPSGEPGRLQPKPQSGCGDPAVTPDHGSNGHVADPEGGRRRAGWPWGSAEHDPSRSVVAAPGLAVAAAHTAGEGRRSAGWPVGRGAASPRGEVEDWPEPARGTWWAAEPDVGRVAHGVPRRVDRLRALGNAVVPQVAEHVGRLVMAAA